MTIAAFHTGSALIFSDYCLCFMIRKEYRSIRSDIIRTLIWSGIGVLVVRHGQLLKTIFSLVMILLFISIILCVIWLEIQARYSLFLF